MWQTFWGSDLTRLSPSNSRGVVPGSWRMEITPSEPALDDRFLTVLHIGDEGAATPPPPEAIDGFTIAGAAVGDTLLAFVRDRASFDQAEMTLPARQVHQLYVAGVLPNATYELHWTDLGIPRGMLVEKADDGGVLHVAHEFAASSRLRVRLVATGPSRSPRAASRPQRMRDLPPPAADPRRGRCGRRCRRDAPRPHRARRAAAGPDGSVRRFESIRR
jgi:hypothetical protein